MRKQSVSPIELALYYIYISISFPTPNISFHVIFTTLPTETSKQFKLRPEDVFIATFPKCGTTWTQKIVQKLHEVHGTCALEGMVLGSNPSELSPLRSIIYLMSSIIPTPYLRSQFHGWVFSR